MTACGRRAAGMSPRNNGCPLGNVFCRAPGGNVAPNAAGSPAGALEARLWWCLAAGSNWLVGFSD